MKSNLLIFSMGISFLTLSFANDIRLFSRNMPYSCDYVTTVESDLRLELPAASDESEVFYELQNSWEPSTWTESAPLVIRNIGPKDVAEITLKTMSIPEHFLYRNIRIHLPERQMICTAEFGREFGEACRRGGRDATPWRERVLTCKNNSN